MRASIGKVHGTQRQSPSLLTETSVERNLPFPMTAFKNA